MGKKNLWRSKKVLPIVWPKPGVPAILSIPDHNEVRLGSLKKPVEVAGLTAKKYRKLSIDAKTGA
jgi:hypothetical protein